jgi:diguanylate cyclase (GGDEF)-like protein
MGDNFMSASITSRGLRYKLFVAFALMSFIPLLVIVYLLSSYIIPQVNNIALLAMIVISILFTLVLALLGLILVKKIVEPIIKLSLDTKVIAEGDLRRHLKITGEDEIADLGRSINLMTRKIKDYLLELQTYTVKTKEINIDIQKKVVVLSSLLQIGDMIATSEKLETICDTIVQKVSEIDEENFTALFLAKEGTVTMELKASSNIKSKAVKGLSFNIDKGFIGTSVRGKMPILIDASVNLRAQHQNVQSHFKAKNCFIVPLVSHGNGIGFLVTGNNMDSFKFQAEDRELIKVLCKQLGIAIENTVLLSRAKELVVKDELTGLYNEKYIRERLDEEIQRSILYQRPCSLLLFNVDNFKEFRDSHGEMATEEALKRVASVLIESSTGISKAARLGGDEFAVVLSERNKKQAADLAEQMRKKIEVMGNRLAKKGEKSLTISGSVSENPLDGSSSDELFNKASDAMKMAKQEGKNRIYK